MFLGFSYLLYFHLNYQSYHNQKLNCFYSSIWFSLCFQSLVYIFFIIFKIKLIHPIFIGIGILGFVCGWYLNEFYYKYYSNKIYTGIIKKYSQQHVIKRLKEEIEFNHINDESFNSLETIGKNIIYQYLYYLFIIYIYIHL